MKDQDKDAIRLMPNGTNVYIHLPEESGAEVHRTNGRYVLYEVPLYGGGPRYSGTHNTAEEVAEMIESWT